MLRARLAVGLGCALWLAATSCGGNTSDNDGARTGGAANDAGSAAESGNAGAGSSNTGGAGLGGSGALGSGGSPAGSGGIAAGGSAGIGGSSGSAGVAACHTSRDCIVRPRSCCGDCGAATRSDVIAIARDSANAYTSAVCEGAGCPPCFRPQDPTLMARCENAACALVDLTALPLTECRSDSDCRVRVATCCECEGNVSPDALIAIRSDSEVEFQRLACDPVISCDACIPAYPEQAKAACFMGRCTITGQPGTTPI